MRISSWNCIQNILMSVFILMSLVLNRGLVQDCGVDEYYEEMEADVHSCLVLIAHNHFCACGCCRDRAGRDGREQRQLYSKRIALLSSMQKHYDIHLRLRSNHQFIQLRGRERSVEVISCIAAASY